MKLSYIFIACIQFLIAPCISQSFSFNSSSPFGSMLVKGAAGITTSHIYFFDYDFDGDKDLFQAGLDYIDNVPKPEWENLHSFLAVQQNIGDSSNPVFSDPVNFDSDFPFPIGYFFPTMGDLNADGISDFLVNADIDDIGNQRLLQYTGQEGNYTIRGLDTAGLYSFVAESFFVPHLVDLDLDGDLDIIMSGFDPAFGEENGADVPNIYYGRNAGTSTNPVFQGWFQNPFGLLPNPYAETLSSGDIDNDGDIDLVGATLFLPADSVSYIHVHLNAPAAGRPNFPQTLNSPFGLPVLNGTNQFFSPNLVDIDGDNDLDFFVIELTSDTSYLHFYENELCAPEQSEMEVSICEGDVFEFMGVTYDQGGVYEVVTEGSDGCDSTIILTIDVLPLVTSDLSVTICSGEEFSIGSDIFTKPGDYVVFIAASNGCDSIINLTIQVLPAINVPIDQLLCEGDVFIIGGDTLSEAGSYSYLLEAQNGCDSIVQLTLIVDIVDPSVTINGNTLTANLLNGTYQWFNCDTGEDVPFASGQSFTPTTTGNYAVRLTDEFGCTATSACTLVVITSVEDEELSNRITLYPNPASDRVFVMHNEVHLIESVTVTDICGQSIHMSKLENGNSIDVSGLAAGMYLIKMKMQEKMVIKTMLKL